MAEIESKILNAITALGVFSKVRYLVAASESENEPTQLPLFIYSDGGRDFEAFRDFAGTSSSVFIQRINVAIIADTAAQVRALSKQAVSALTDIAVYVEGTDTFDEELNAYVSELSFTATP